MVRPELMSRFFTVYRPERDEDTGSSLLGGRKAVFLQICLAKYTTVSPLSDYFYADSATLAELTVMVTQKLWNSLGKDRSIGFLRHNSP